MAVFTGAWVNYGLNFTTNIYKGGDGLDIK